MPGTSERPSPAASAARRRGRPPACSEQERRRRILTAAEQLFAEHGFAAATMDDVARTAGMSKRTVYGLYPDKNRLLAAVVVAADDFPWEQAAEAPPVDAHAELRRRLLAIVEFMLSPRQIRLTRLLIAEARQVPELADSFHERVMGKSRRYLEAAIEHVTAAAAAPAGIDAAHVAGSLLGAATAELHVLALFGKDQEFSRDRIAARVDAALKMCGFASRRRRSRD